MAKYEYQVDLIASVVLKYVNKIGQLHRYFDKDSGIMLTIPEKSAADFAYDGDLLPELIINVERRVRVQVSNLHNPKFFSFSGDVLREVHPEQEYSPGQYRQEPPPAGADIAEQIDNQVLRDALRPGTVRWLDAGEAVDEAPDRPLQTSTRREPPIYTPRQRNRR